MDSKIKSLLDGKLDNYILPFFWQHGEDEKTLREYMRVINECGIGAVCVESRPHPDYCGPKWWEDMDVIMDEARKRGMKVWVLDDSHFPTGFANGAVDKAPDELCKQFLYYNSADIYGPTPSAQLSVSNLIGIRRMPGDGSPFRRSEPRVFNDDSLFRVVAYKVVGRSIVSGSMTDLTGMVKDGELVWNVPEGMWRVFVMFLTRNGGKNTHYINVIDRRSCRIQLDAVYEPHYERYGADFGGTFAGFFSDEPEFGNSNAHGFEHRIGKEMELPWSDEVPAELEKRLGENWASRLAALWYDTDDSDEKSAVRYAYMDTVTRLVERDFSEQIGEWCERHGVEYIGHIIEDNNQHARLGQSFGHFFRGLNGQHMAGIDDIGGQVVVAGEDHFRKGMMGGELTADGEFYHFALGKLGSSHAHIDPKKKGRAMCEIYGAYGWGTGVRTMKYLTDHFLVRGINHYVPHAFTPKAFPDPDCPPHFYAHGENPQIKHFGRLMHYMNRVCNLINGGTHLAPVALLYHGEAEWTGEYMLLQKPARQLAENQIDYDIIPSDVFTDRERYNADFSSSLKINGEEYKALVIPYTQYITAELANYIANDMAGVRVIFVDALPEAVIGGAALPEAVKGCPVVELDRLADYLEPFADISIQPAFRRLRYYRHMGESEIIIFSNEDQSRTFKGTVTLPSAGKQRSAYIYDAWENVLRPADIDGDKLRLTLPAFQTAILVFGEAEGETVPYPKAEGAKQTIDEWSVSYCEAKQYPNFTGTEKRTALDSVSLEHPDFSGFIRYDACFNFSGGRAVLAFDNAYEGVEVWVNGEYAGLKICPPFLFDISGLVRQGENSIRIEVANNLDRKVNALPVDPNNHFAAAFGRSSGFKYPSGLVGEVAVYSVK